MKILKVCYKQSYQDSYKINKPYYYRVDDDFKTQVGSLVLVEPKLILPESDINLQLALVLEIIDLEISNENGVTIMNLETQELMQKSRVPNYIASLDLTEYFERKKKEKRKAELEDILNNASMNLEKITMFKALSELNPEYKNLFDEYMSLQFNDKKLLN